MGHFTLTISRKALNLDQNHAFFINALPAKMGLISGDSGTRATRAEPKLQNDAEATPALGLLGLSLSYEMMEGLLLFKF